MNDDGCGNEEHGSVDDTSTARHTADTRALGPFQFEHGGSVPELELAYETYGEYDPEGGPNGRGNAVLVCHALTGSQHVASSPGEGDDGTTSDPTAGADDQARAWWDDVVGAGNAIDTNQYFVVCVNVPGSCYGSTGPASPHPDGGVWGSSFPAVTVGDWTRAQRRLLDSLGVERLHAVVGGSVGGMNALDWVRRYPESVDRVAPVATAARLDAQLLGMSAVARRAIRGDPEWHGGEYVAEGTHPDQGLALARQLGHLSYLSKDSMERKFGREERDRGIDSPFPAPPAAEAVPDREVENYLDYQAAGFVERFDANSYLYLTRAMEGFDLADGHASDADALAGFDGEALVLSITGDWHFTVADAAALTSAFEAAGSTATHHVVDSDHGHDAFLVEPAAVGPPLRTFLAGSAEDVADRLANDESDMTADARGDDDRNLTDVDRNRTDDDPNGTDGEPDAAERDGDSTRRGPVTPGTACSGLMG
ncbi:homoserine O-acetyltransferase [Halolamina litorea]|uniref:Homoserine O-acetyltransferase n=1 Tax=Halolamina litorea TaxID=1515593 RepID=A0ABD6BQP6_9EURY